MKEKLSLKILENKDFRNTHVNLETNQEAALTHYLHNSNELIKNKFIKEASLLVKKIFEYTHPEDEITLEVAEDALQFQMFDYLEIPFLPKEIEAFTFIDLFAGVGGFRLALQNIGGKCIYSSEWDIDAKKTYRINFGEIPFGDITKQETKNFIPQKFEIGRASCRERV